MNKKKFTKVVELQKDVMDTYFKLNEMGIEVSERDNKFNDIIEILWREILTKDGINWLYWYMYENDFGTKKMEAKDEKGNPICYDIDSLYDFLCDNDYFVNYSEDE